VCGCSRDREFFIVTRSSIRFAVFICLSAIGVPSVVLDAQPYSFRHFAGYPGGSGQADGQTPQDAMLAGVGLAVSQDGILYVADGGNSLVRQMEADGTVSTLFGNGSRRDLEASEARSGAFK